MKRIDRPRDLRSASKLRTSIRLDADRQSDRDEWLGRDSVLLGWRLAFKVKALYEANIAGRAAHQHLKLARFGDPAF